MGSAAQVTEPTSGTEKLLHHPVGVEVEEEEDAQVADLERKKSSSFPHGKRPDSADSSTITNNTSSSSSFSGDVFPNDEVPDHISLENLEVPESPEKETEIRFHEEEEHDDGNNCNVYFDGEQGIWKCHHCDWTYRDESLLCSETKGTESAVDAHDSQAADSLNGERKALESETGSASEDNKGSREIEEVDDGDLPKEVDDVDRPAGEVIEEEVEIGDVGDYDVVKVLDNQETHDLFCPNCNACITKRVVLKRRKRKIPHELEDPKRPRGTHQTDLKPHETDTPLYSEDNVPSADDGENSRRESFVFKCLSCFSIFIPKGVGSKPLPPSEAVEGLKTQPKPQGEVTGESNWFSSIFGFSKTDSAAHQGGTIPSVTGANLPRDNLNLSGNNTPNSAANTTSEVPAFVQRGEATSIQDGSEISASQGKEPVDTSFNQGASSHDTSKVVNNGASVENGQKFLVPLTEEEQSQQNIKDDAVGSEKGSLSPIHPSPDMKISNTVTSGPDGVKVETIFHGEGVSHPFVGTDSSDSRKPDFSLPTITTVMDTGGVGVTTSLQGPGIDVPQLPVSTLQDGTLTEPLVRPVVERATVEGRKVEILKSIVYGGLIESITSLGVISSAAGSGASVLNILVLGLANLFGGLILIIHNLQELREEEPIRATTNTQVERGRYKRLLGQRENFTLHATVAIISFIIAGLLPPVVYYFSFSNAHNRDYKVASVFGASLVLIVLLALAKAHVKTPRGSHLKSVLYYALIAVSVSGISYVVGNFLDQLLEKYGWSDGTETPAGLMMLPLMGRKAGSFGYSTS